MLIKAANHLPKRIILVLTLLSLLLCSCIQKKAPSEESQPPPNKYDNYPTVIIDAGHGGEDSGAIGIDGCLEKHLNLSVATELEILLKSQGINTRLTRTEDILLYDRNSDYQGHKKSQDMAARIKISQEYSNAVFVSIHMNSFPQSQYSGLQVYYSPNSPNSKILADKVQKLTVINLQPENNRQIKLGTDIYILENINHPAILIEGGFISNPNECELLNSQQYRKRLCMVIFSAILQYFDAVENNNGYTT